MKFKLLTSHLPLWHTRLSKPGDKPRCLPAATPNQTTHLKLHIPN